MPLLVIKTPTNHGIGNSAEDRKTLRLNATISRMPTLETGRPETAISEHLAEDAPPPIESGAPPSTMVQPEPTGFNVSEELWAVLLPFAEPYQDNPAYLNELKGLSYFRRSELSKPPLLESAPAIIDPDNAEMEKKRGGKATLRVFISATGEVDRIEIIHSDLSQDHEDAVLAAFLPLKFRPGELQGVAVTSQIIFEADFDNLARGTSRASDGLRWWGKQEKSSN